MQKKYWPNDLWCKEAVKREDKTSKAEEKVFYQQEGPDVGNLV